MLQHANCFHVESSKLAPTCTQTFSTQGVRQAERQTGSERELTQYCCVFEALIVCYVGKADEGSRRRVATKRQWKRHWCLDLRALLQQSHLEASVCGASSIRYTSCNLASQPARNSLFVSRLLPIVVE